MKWSAVKAQKGITAKTSNYNQKFGNVAMQSSDAFKTAAGFLAAKALYNIFAEYNTMDAMKKFPILWITWTTPSCLLPR